MPNIIADNSTGDVVASHYYLYKQDIARLKALGIPAFSPSISWPRIFPFGKGPINEAGVAHYDDVVRTAVEAGLTLAITLFHWDTPLALFNEYGACPCHSSPSPSPSPRLRHSCSGTSHDAPLQASVPGG